MQLVQFFIFSFFISFLMSSSHLFFGLPSGLLNISFHLYTYRTRDIKTQTTQDILFVYCLNKKLICGPSQPYIFLLPAEHSDKPQHNLVTLEITNYWSSPSDRDNTLVISLSHKRYERNFRCSLHVRYINSVWFGGKGFHKTMAEGDWTAETSGVSRVTIRKVIIL